MKIADRDEFLALPAGTWFCRQPAGGTHVGCWDGPHVKGDTLEWDGKPGEDYWEHSLSAVDPGDSITSLGHGELAEAERRMRNEGESFPLDVAESRGLFDYESEYLIFEPADLDVVIELATQAKAVAK
jgi:hypothetical protein